MKSAQRIFKAAGILICLLLAFSSSASAPAAGMKNLVVAGESRRFAAWPANNGVWIWDGREIVVGFSYGPFEEQEGHNIGRPILSMLARSEDGGESWKIEDPDGYVGDGKKAVGSPGNINFTHPDFAMRVYGIGYLAEDDVRGGFFVSYDRAKTWQGPYSFDPLMDSPELKGYECTSRTDYLVMDRKECLIFMSARKTGTSGNDKTFCARTVDGGRSFQFYGWILPPSDPYRGVMPATVRCSPALLVSALRRRIPGQEKCWVDAYASKDNGRSWAFLSLIGETGGRNGNPPALLRMKDGRLCAAYGNRAKRQMRMRYSRDDGATWGDEIVLRDDFSDDQFNDADLGYPRVVQRADGRLVFFYYWATKERPHQHIAATIVDPAVAK